MKTFRKLIKKYIKEWAAWFGFFILYTLVALLAMTLLALPGIAIAYLCGWPEWEISGIMSISGIVILITIGRGIWKVCKDYQELKREEREYE